MLILNVKRWGFGVLGCDTSMATRKEVEKLMKGGGARVVR